MCADERKARMSEKMSGLMSADERMAQMSGKMSADERMARMSGKMSGGAHRVHTP